MKNHGATFIVAGVGVVIVGFGWVGGEVTTTVEGVVGTEVGDVTGIDNADVDGVGSTVVVVRIVAPGSDEPVAQAEASTASATVSANLILISR